MRMAIRGTASSSGGMRLYMLMFLGVTAFLLFGLVAMTFAAFNFSPPMGERTSLTDRGLLSSTSIVIRRPTENAVLVTGRFLKI